LYAADERGSLFRTVVKHPPWRCAKPEVKIAANTIGLPFHLELSTPPDVTHFSAGVHARVWPFALQR
jgi:hypothetical protein